MKTIPMISLAALCVAINLANPHPAQADASASSQLTFNNLTITPSGGTLQVSNWNGSVFAQATVNSQSASGVGDLAVTVPGDFSTASGSANAGTPNAGSAGNAMVTGDEADNASGQGWVTTFFTITGGSGDVSTLFSVQIDSSLNVLTDVNGQLAQAENVFSVDLSGSSSPVVFNDQFSSIGPSDSDTQNVATVLSGSLTLEYNTAYELYVTADSEVSVVSVPEPGTAGLLGAGALACIWAGRKKLRGRLKEFSALLLFLGAGGVAQATYIGADSPDVCPTCGVQPTRQPGGTVSTSLTEGNLREDYPVTTLQSGSGPTVQLSLTYNSYNADGSRAEIDSGLGIGWTFSYNQFLFNQRGSFFQMGTDGRVTLYRMGVGGVYTTDAGYFETLSPQPDGSLIITNKFQTWWHFASVPGTPFQVGGPVYRLTQMGDRNGNVTTLTYVGGLLTQIQDVYGRSVTMTYTNRHLFTVTDPLGRVTTFQYDSRIRTPIRITDPDGKVTRYTYNAQYQMTRKIDRDGNTYSYLYRNLKPWAVMDGNGQTFFYMQNSNNWTVDHNALAYTLRRTYLPSTVTNVDGNGHAWSYQYDTNGYITTVIAPDGATTSYSYDAQLRTVTAKTNADGAVTLYQYDSQGNRTNVTDALGNVTSYTYDPVFSELTSLTDPNGRTTTYQYDAHGNRTNEIDPLLQTQSWTYDSHGNVLNSTDKDGHTTTFIYDPSGNCTNMTDPLGQVTSYVYDAVGNRVATTDPNDHTTTYTYDGLNRLLIQTNALDGVTAYVYDGVGRQTSVTDALGRTTQYEYDQRGRRVEMIDPIGGMVTYGYDANNNQVAMTNQLGNPTTCVYDSQNRRVAEVDALGHTTSYVYDGVGNLTTNIDRNGHSTVYAYDALNRRITVTDALGDVTSYDYSTPGGPPCCSATLGSDLVTRYEDANGYVTFYHYDELNRLTQIVQKQGDTNDTITPSDALTSYVYDPVGNRISVTDPAVNTTTYGYDPLNRVIASTNAAGDITSTIYDPVGNVIASIAPNENVTTTIYDGLNRAITVYDPIGPVATNGYDAVGNRLAYTDANGNTTMYVYDGLDRRIATTDALGKSSITTYDGAGNVTTNMDRDGNTTSYQYDAVNRRISLYDALGHTTSYAYDPVGNVTNLMDANGHTTSYTYDALNRRLTEVSPDAPPNTVTYMYDPSGHLVSRTDQKGQVTTYSYSQLYYPTNRSYFPSGSSDSFTYDLAGRMLSADRNGWVDTFGYDGANRLVYTTQNGRLITYSYNIPGRLQTNTYPSGRIIRQTTDGRNRLLTRQEGVNPPIVTYTYDAANRVLSRTNGNGTVTSYMYDADNRVVSLETSNAVGRVVGFGYSYDFEGNRRSELKRHAPADSEAYNYDGLNRLTNYDVGTLLGNTVPSPALAKAWNLDPLGNWNNVVSNSVVVDTQTFGPANELLTINAQPLDYDANGNLARDLLYNYFYDEENRLTEVQRISDLAVVGSYYYDALGRRVIAITDPAAVLATNVFFYDHARLIEEENNAGVSQATYVYGNYVDELVTMDRGAQTYYYHQNMLWSPHALTDSSGNVVELYTYDAYGGVIVLNPGYSPLPLNAWGTPHSAVGNPYLFTGRELDEESGLYYYRARCYDSSKGRFLQRDPLDYVGGLNLYEYVQDRPTILVDPTGLKECKPRLLRDQIGGGNLPYSDSKEFGVEWLPGSNWYDWSGNMTATATDSGISAEAVSKARTLWWYSVSKSRWNATSKGSGKVWCECKNQQCVASASGGGEGTTDTVVGSGVLITAQASGDTAKLSLQIAVSLDAAAAVSSVSVGVEQPLPGGGKATVGAAFQVQGNKVAKTINVEYPYKCE